MMTLWHQADVTTCLNKLETTADGLTSVQAAERLARDGENKLESGKKRTLLGIFLSQFRDFMIWVLIAAAAISAALGEPVDAAIIAVVVILNAVMGTVQESRAEAALEALQEMGGTCVKNVCKFDEMADVFYIDIEATFFGTAKEGKWSAGPGYSISIGAQSMEHVVSFSVQRAVSDEVTQLGNAPWTFTMEELLIPGTSEPPDPAEPFVLSVSRSNGDEQFTGCRFTSQQRQDTIRGVTQIRKGTAESRNVMGIL